MEVTNDYQSKTAIIQISLITVLVKNDLPCNAVIIRNCYFYYQSV